MTRRLLTNAGAVLTGETLQRAATFAVYLLVARALEPLAFGQLSLALTLLYAAQVVAGFGLRTYLAREVAKDRDGAGSALLHGIALVALAATASLALVAAWVRVAGYAPDTAAIVLLLALAAVPHALGAVCEGLFQAHERMLPLAAVHGPLHVGKVVVAWFLLQGGAGLVAVAWTLVAAQAAIAALELALALRWFVIGRPRPVLSARRLAALARGAAAFLGLDAAIAWWSSLPVVLLSLLRGELEVGLFNAAAQLLVPVALVLQSATVAVFPIMARRHAEGAARLAGVAHGLLAAMLALALPAAAGLVVVAPDALRLVYGGEDFAAATIALRVMAVMPVFRAVTTALGQVLLAGMRERVTLRIVLVNGVVTLALVLWLVPSLGVLGAALAVTLAGAVNVVQHLPAVARLVGGVRWWAAGWRPLAATGVMLAALWAAGPPALPIAIALGAGAYGLALAVLWRWSPGGPAAASAPLAQPRGRP